LEEMVERERNMAKSLEVMESRKEEDQEKLDEGIIRVNEAHKKVDAVRKEITEKGSTALNRRVETEDEADRVESERLLKMEDDKAAADYAASVANSKKGGK